MEVNSVCAVCQLGEETLEHVIWTCFFAKRCWEEAHLNWQNLEGMYTPYILASLLDNGITKAFEMFSMVAWSLWNHGNTVVWRGHHQTPKMVNQTASDQLVQWQKAQSNNSTTMRSHSEGATKWQKSQ